jgi:hypothetical protein
VIAVDFSMYKCSENGCCTDRQIVAWRRRACSTEWLSDFF